MRRMPPGRDPPADAAPAADAATRTAAIGAARMRRPDREARSRLRQPGTRRNRYGARMSPDAFDELVAPHRAGLHAHCYRMLGSVHDADDALQDALLGAWRGIDG